MKTMLATARSWAAIAAAVVTLNGCFFGGSLSVTSNFEGGIVSISVGNVDIGTCFAEPQGIYDCIFPNNVESVFQVLTLPQLLLRLVVLDPLVLQVPAGVTNFQGSFSHAGGASGQLAITAGLASVRIDLNRTLTAEPGMQLVVVGLPPTAPTTGVFAFNLNFRVPAGTTSLPVKPIITGLVELNDGTVFYPPILPCAQTMGNAPALSIPLPAPGDTFTLPPLTPALGCNNVVYDYIAGDGAAAADIPLLGPWALLALAILLGGTATAAIRRGR